MLALILTVVVIVIWAVVTATKVPMNQSAVMKVMGAAINVVVGQGWRPGLKPIITWEIVDTRKGKKMPIELLDLLSPYIDPDDIKDLMQMEPVNLQAVIVVDYYIADPFVYLKQADPEGLFKEGTHAELRARFLGKRILDNLQPQHQKVLIGEATPEIQSVAKKYGFGCEKVYLTRIEPEDKELERAWENKNRERAEAAGEVVQAQADISKARMYAAARMGLPNPTDAELAAWTDYPTKNLNTQALRDQFNGLVDGWLDKIQLRRIQQESAKGGHFINVSSDVIRAVGGKPS